MENKNPFFLLSKKLITQHLTYFGCIFLLLISIPTCAQTPIVHISTGTQTVGLEIYTFNKHDSIPVFVSNGATIINAEELKNVEFKHEKCKIKYTKKQPKAPIQNKLSKVSKKLTPKKENLQLVKEINSSGFFIKSQQKISLILTSNQEIQNAYLVLESKFLLSFFSLKSQILSKEQCIVIDEIFINLKDRGPPYYV